MGVRDFLEEEHPTMFVSTDSKIGWISGVSFVRTHVYVREAPRWIPDRLWYALADKLTYTVSESYDPAHPIKHPIPDTNIYELHDEYNKKLLQAKENQIIPPKPHHHKEG